MRETLKPCPFCRGEAVVEQGKDCWWVECFEIPCQVSGSTREHRADAIAAWNRRAEPEESEESLFLARFIVGWWPGLESGFDWPNPEESGRGKSVYDAAQAIIRREET